MGWGSGLRPLTGGGRKCRNLPGSLSLVAESVVIYLGAYGWGSGLRPLTGGGRKRRNLHGSLSLVAESVVIHLGAYGVGARFATSDRWWPKVS